MSAGLQSLVVLRLACCLFPLWWFTKCEENMWALHNKFVYAFFLSIIFSGNEKQINLACTGCESPKPSEKHPRFIKACKAISLNTTTRSTHVMSKNLRQAAPWCFSFPVPVPIYFDLYIIISWVVCLCLCQFFCLFCFCCKGRNSMLWQSMQSQ